MREMTLVLYRLIQIFYHFFFFIYHRLPIVRHALRVLKKGNKIQCEKKDFKLTRII